jgi:hypothetical protein
MAELYQLYVRVHGIHSTQPYNPAISDSPFTPIDWLKWRKRPPCKRRMICSRQTSLRTSNLMKTWRGKNDENEKSPRITSATIAGVLHIFQAEERVVNQNPQPHGAQLAVDLCSAHAETECTRGRWLQKYRYWDR